MAEAPRFPSCNLRLALDGVVKSTQNIHSTTTVIPTCRKLSGSKGDDVACRSNRGGSVNLWASANHILIRRLDVWLRRDRRMSDIFQNVLKIWLAPTVAQ